MRKTLLLAFVLTLVSASQINYLAGGSPAAIQTADGRYVVATSGMLYVFAGDGSLENYMNLDGISDMAIAGDVLVVTLTSQDFPNVRAFSFPGLEPLWDFEPEIDVFDMSLIWTRKQTRSWRVKPVTQGFGVVSGYTLFVFSESGRLLGNFSASSDIWDFYEDDGFYLATQEGALYVLDSDLHLVEKRALCREYELIERVSNSTLRVFPRSVWEVNSNLAVCEDGTVHFMDGSPPVEVRSYSSSQLYSYYYQSRRETGYGAQMFRNLRLVGDGQVSVVFTSEKLSVFSGSELVWEQEATVADVDIYDGRVYVLTVNRLGLEVVKVYDAADGSLLDEIEVKGIACDKGTREILAGEEIMTASACEIKLFGDSGKVLWYLPMSEAADFVERGDFRVFFTDNEPTQYQMAEFYSMFAMEGDELKWTYSLPDSMARTGHLSDVHIVGDDVTVAVYSGSEYDSLVVVELNGSSRVINATDRKYAGALDTYLTNRSILNFVKNYSFGQLEGIPEEFKYGNDTDPDRWGESNVLLWLEILRRLPVPVEAMDGLRDVVNNMDGYLLRQKIRSTDTCDYNSDGFQDLLVATDSWFVVRDGRTMGELLFKDSNTWRYENNRINRPYLANLTANWFTGGGGMACLEDMNGDARGELFVSTWEGNATMLFSSASGYVVRWQTLRKNLQTDRTRETGDIDGDGRDDVVISVWVQDKPDNIFFTSSWDGQVRYAFTPNQYSFRPSVGDVDGDGVNESILTYDQEGASLVVFSPNYNFEYTELREFWETWSTYGRVMPAEIVPDMNDDGYKEIVIGASRRWGDPGMMLLFFSGRDGKLLDTINVVGRAEEMNFDEWQFIPDMRRFGDHLVFTIPGQSGNGVSTGGQLGIYDLSAREMEAYVNREVKEVVSYGDDIVVIGTSGEVFWLGTEEMPTPGVSAEGSVVHVTSDPGYYTTVYVDGGVAATGREPEFDVRLSNGDHEVVVSLSTENGLEQLFTHEVATFSGSNLGFLNLIIIVFIVGFAVFKVVTKWK